MKPMGTAKMPLAIALVLALTGIILGAGALTYATLPQPSGGVDTSSGAPPTSSNAGTGCAH
jgi:hypothetical protein